MSATIHIKTTVLPGGKIEISSSEMAEGQVVDVTVIIRDTLPQEKQRAADVLARMPGHRHFKTVEEADAYLREERDSWE